MKLSTKIMISFLIITIVPLGLATISAYAMLNFQYKVLEQNYGVKVTSYDALYNPVKLLDDFTVKTFLELSELSEKYPEKLLDQVYLNDLNKNLEKRFSFLIIRVDDSIEYSGRDVLDIEAKLPDYGAYSTGKDGGLLLNGNPSYLIKQKDFVCPSGKEGTVFIVMRIGELLPEIKNMLYEMLILVISITVVTGLLLTLWIYRSVLRPLRKLKKATNYISEGNLDFTIEAYNQDEFGELMTDFELMRKKLKESVEVNLANDMESKELISNISHDLKTPITAIKGYVEGIMDGVADTPAKMDKYLKTIYNKANDMDRLIGELTIFSKIDTNRIPYNFAKVNIIEYFNDCYEEIKIELESKNIRFSYYYDIEASTTVIADVEQLKRVVNNIISNSVKYSNAKDSVIDIKIIDEGDYVQVAISDNGKGIPAKDVPYIFDRFYRADASRNSTQGGSGIGLAIAKKVIEAHGGHIWATSKENEGTVIHFVLRKIYN